MCVCVLGWGGVTDSCPSGLSLSLTFSLSPLGRRQVFLTSMGSGGGGGAAPTDVSFDGVGLQQAYTCSRSRLDSHICYLRHAWCRASTLTETAPWPLALSEKGQNACAASQQSYLPGPEAPVLRPRCLTAGVVVPSAWEHFPAVDSLRRTVAAAKGSAWS